MGILFIDSGLYTTVQDEGRYKYQQYGMPVGGAMDLYSMYLGNVLVGNKLKTEVLEATILSPKIEFTQSNIFAVTGGECECFLSGTKIEMNKAYLAQKDDILECGVVKCGARVYFAFAGGMDIPLVMGSKSTYVKGKIGGYLGRAIAKNDGINFIAPQTCLKNMEYRQIPKSYLYPMEDMQTLRVIMGPQLNDFSEKGIDTFLNSIYTVTNESDRMGYRLEGDKISHIEGSDGNIISDAIAFGAIQVPAHGRPIIMMADRQTTGGYSKIANVISVDLPKIAQLKSGDKIKFEQCDLATAQSMYVQKISSIRQLKALFEENEIDSISAYEINLEDKKYEVIVHEIK